MKRIIVAVLVLLSSTVATAADFDIEAYCKEVSKEAPDRHQAEKSCRDQEEAARDKLDGMNIPSGAESHCYEVAKSVGGSYRAMNDCVRQELSNEKRGD